MKRLVIMTVGKTHSGKTTFAKALAKELSNSVVIDQDNHAEFLQLYYQPLVPKQGSNSIKYAITKTIVNAAINETDCHLILCNSNRNVKARLHLLEQYHEDGFMSILVNFDVPENVLKERVSTSQRSTSILRTATSFEEVLTRQQNDTGNDVVEPMEGEADHLFTIKNEEDVQSVIRSVVRIACTDRTSTTDIGNSIVLNTPN